MWRWCSTDVSVHWDLKKQEQVKSAREYAWTWTIVWIFVREGLNSELRQKVLPQGRGLIYKYCDLMMLTGRHNIKLKLWAKASCKLNYWLTYQIFLRKKGEYGEKREVALRIPYSVIAVGIRPTHQFVAYLFLQLPLHFVLCFCFLKALLWITYSLGVTMSPTCSVNYAITVLLWQCIYSDPSDG